MITHCLRKKSSYTTASPGESRDTISLAYPRSAQESPPRWTETPPRGMTRYSRFPRSVEGSFLQVIKQVWYREDGPSCNDSDTQSEETCIRENGFWITHAANIS